MATGSLIDRLLAWLFPDRCASCRAVGSLFCSSCQRQLEPYHEAQRLPPPQLDRVQIGFIFQGPLREAIHHLKYRHCRRIAEPLAVILCQHIAQSLPKVDVVMPIPLHPSRQAERGYNQSEELARYFAAHAQIPHQAEGLVRLRATQQQAKLDARARLANINGAFAWEGARPPARVLLLDDVLTTGATMSDCARALRVAGTHEVYGIALARSRLT